MSFTTESPVMLEEVCFDLAPLEVTEDRAEVSCYVSATPPLVSREIIALNITDMC